MATTHHARTQSERSDLSRARILEAAIRQFSENGLAGARTDRIAEDAGVNKALLYYYFESKEKLYVAALQSLATEVHDRNAELFRSETTPAEKIVRAALHHFDRILAQREFQSLMHQEMVRLHKGEAGAMPLLVERVFQPSTAMFETAVREGIASGELIDADWMQLQLAAIGGNILYFLSSPIWRMYLSMEPLASESLAHRRKALVEYLGQAIFTDRAHGAEVAARVLADTPMPEFSSKDLFHGVRNECKK